MKIAEQKGNHVFDVGKNASLRLCRWMRNKHPNNGIDELAFGVP